MHDESTTLPPSSQAQAWCRKLAMQALSTAQTEYPDEYECRVSGEVLSLETEDGHIQWLSTAIDLLTPLLARAYAEGRRSVLGDLSKPVVELPPSGLVVHDICQSCGSTLIGSWDKRAATLELGLQDGWHGGLCGECRVDVPGEPGEPCEGRR